MSNDVSRLPARWREKQAYATREVDRARERGDNESAAASEQGAQVYAQCAAELEAALAAAEAAPGRSDREQVALALAALPVGKRKRVLIEALVAGMAPDTDADRFSWRDDPQRHAFEPNGDGHEHNPGGCWWCGRPRADHATERVRVGWEDAGRGVWKERPIRPVGKGGGGA